MTMPASETQMAVRVLCFAQVKDALGKAEFGLRLPRGARGYDFVSRLVGEYPALKPLLEVSRLAVNGVYTSFDIVLNEGDEIVIIPPVSGG